MVCLTTPAVTCFARWVCSQYDVSNDGMLSRTEMTAVMRELAEKEAELQAEAAHADVAAKSTPARNERSPQQPLQVRHVLTGACCTAPTPSTALRIAHHAPGEGV